MDALVSGDNGLLLTVQQQVLTDVTFDEQKVTIGSTVYPAYECGKQLTVSGKRHTNVCFYHSAAATFRYICITNYVRSSVFDYY